MKKLAVFCGSSLGYTQAYQDAAIDLADTLCAQEITLIYGGAKVGLMGVLADQMIKQGGQVIGVIPQALVDVEIAHNNLTKLHIVDSMHARKNLIASLADAFLMLPGGPGSLEEFFEMMTAAQLGYHDKPCSILNVEHYYDLLLKFLDHAVCEGFLKSLYRNIIITDDNPKLLIQKITNYQAPHERKWVKDTVTVD